MSCHVSPGRSSQVHPNPVHNVMSCPVHVCAVLWCVNHVISCPVHVCAVLWCVNHVMSCPVHVCVCRVETCEQKVYLGWWGEGHQDGEGGEMVARAGCVGCVPFQQPAAVFRPHPVTAQPHRPTSGDVCTFTSFYRFTSCSVSSYLKGCLYLYTILFQCTCFPFHSASLPFFFNTILL